MQIPETKRAARNNVCPAGTHRARVDSVVDLGGGRYRACFTCMPAGTRRRYRLDHETDMPGLLDIAIDLGLGGQELEPDDIAGTCQVQVRTFGGKRSARIVGTEPLGA